MEPAQHWKKSPNDEVNFDPTIKFSILIDVKYY